MDLGASASFVAEPAEPSLDTRPPRDPRIPFLDKTMLTGIAIGALALFVTVFLPYWLALHEGKLLAVAQSAAFSAWMIGHVLLAFFSRSAHDPLYRIGLLTNRVMVLWAGGAFLFLALTLLVPAVGQRVGISPLSGIYIAIITGIAVVCMAGIEIGKILKKRVIVQIPDTA
jgi:Ca2+-transporting ATPase